MGKYLKLFNTHIEYQAFTKTSDFIKPNVSHCIAENHVHYNPIPDYSKEYLTFVAKESGTFKLSRNAVSYSLDNGETWTELAAATASPTVTAGNKIIWKGELTPTSWNGIGTFSATGNFDVQGNVMSLLYGDNFNGKTDLTGTVTAFYRLFNNNTKLIDAKNLSLPATTLADNCYNSMFFGCTGLTTAPELPAQTLATYCYIDMFNGCTSLTTAPELPATTLESSCYSNMFYGCSSLTTAPVLPAQTLTEACYSGMFSECTSLVNAPQLPATTLVTACYSGMFHGCTSLTTAPELLVETLDEGCYRDMFSECTSLVNAPSLPATTLAHGCYDSMFYGCTSLVNAPELPATTLADECYSDMFEGCTNLTTAPDLPATTLVTRCYSRMFQDCTKLNYIKAMFTTRPSGSSPNYYTQNWVSGVASSGTFVKNAAATWNVTGVNGVPSGWTVETASA